jgi:deazaflavin-dependent oxidoreductase (nitroreductase family)
VRLVEAFQRRLLNPLVRRLVERGLLRGWCVVETRGRTTGLPRRTPVGYRREGDVVWVVAEFGRRAQWVRNAAADPRVRVCLRGRWHEGTAELLDGDDARARLPRSLNSAAIRLVGRDLLTVRIRLG